MRPLILLITAVIFLFCGCAKSNSEASAADFYGIWVKGNQAGDTLWFMNKGGKNILRYNMTFSPSFTSYNEVEYAYRNNKLCIALFGGSPSELSSFTWKEINHSFELAGYQLFPIMSSTGTVFRFVKL